MKEVMLKEGISFLVSQFMIWSQSWSFANKFWMVHSMSRTGLEMTLMYVAIDLDWALGVFVVSMTLSCSIPLQSSQDTTKSLFLFTSIKGLLASALSSQKTV